MIIRDYHPSDFPHVEALWKETDIFAKERGDTDTIIHRCNSLGGKFLVMEDPENKLIVGTSWMTFDGRRVHLHHFAIRPSSQGKGLGRTLALESLKFAQERNCPVKLEVQQENRPAINLYKSLGFYAFKDYDVFMNLDPGVPLGENKIE